jgi:DNA-binding response OmpR family regulator
VSRPRVLSVSCNQRLLAARHELLEHAGFDVTSVGATFGALDLLENHEFSAVVLCHSFSFTERQLFAADVGERWRIPVIVLPSGDEDFECTGDAQVELTEGAAELVATLKAVIAERAQRSA